MASTDSEFPFCNTVSFSSEIYDYACNNVDISTPQAIFTTYDGQTSDRSFSPMPLDVGSTSIDEDFSGFPRPTEVIDDEDDPEETEDPEPPKKKKSNAGAIAGGVVGGVAVIGMLGLGILFILRRKKNQTPPPSTPATQQTPGWTQPNSPQAPYGSPTGGFYKPNQELPNYAQAVLPPQQQQGLAPAPDRNSSASPRDSTLSGQTFAYQQYQQGIAPGQQLPQGQPMPHGQPAHQVPQGQQPPQVQQHGQGTAPLPELGPGHY